MQAGIRSISRSRGLSILIQSATTAPPELEAEIEHWLKLFRSEVLETMGDEAFGDFRETVARSYERPPKTLNQVGYAARHVW